MGEQAIADDPRQVRAARTPANLAIGLGGNCGVCRLVGACHPHGRPDLSRDQNRLTHVSASRFATITWMLIVCDFDGTATQADTLNHLCTRFAPQVFTQLEGKLMSREMTLREVLAAECGEMRAGHDEIVSAAVAEVPLRDGFEEFVEACSREGHRLVIVSAGFRQLIEPMLVAAGIREYELVANDVEFTSDGGVATFRDTNECDACGERCKRAEVTDMRTEGENVVYIGDGFSDRCGAESADRIFARAGLARYLDKRDVVYESFDDFHEIMRALELDVS